MSAHSKKQLKPSSPIFVVHIPLKISDRSNQTCSFRHLGLAMRHILLFPEYTKNILTSRGGRKDREKIKIMIETGDSTKLFTSKNPKYSSKDFYRCVSYIF
jgi:hypothetical protein